MKTLIVEDDFVSRSLLQEYLSPFTSCDIATAGNEAIWAFGYALRHNTPYDLVCLDIMLPVKDGFHVLEHMRAMEEARGIDRCGCAKIIMTSSLSGDEDINRALRNRSNAYLVKPLSKKQIVCKLVAMGLMETFKNQQDLYSDHDISIMRKIGVC